MSEPELRDHYEDTIEAVEVDGMGWAWVVRHQDGSPGQAHAGYKNKAAALTAGREANVGDHVEAPALTVDDLLGSA